MSSSAAAAAFGERPDQWPLPEARSPQELWLRAVAAGGQGRYAAARADLAGLIHNESAGRWRSLGRSAYGSFLRQLGWHWRAHDWDGRALAAAGTDPGAGADALIGLAADALGVGRLATSAALLERAVGLARNADEPRLEIRLAWVRAELAMAGGDGPDAMQHARRGVELAHEALPSLRRHRVKSDVVLAAALCSAGDLAGSRTVADAALADTETYQLAPLRWALACLLSDIGSASRSPGDIGEVRELSAQFVTRHGGHWKMR
ncbi:MAG: hypothetical protein WCP30_06240 [Mycobacteriaceae bacterium]